MPLFTPDEAAGELRLLLPVLDEIVALRADAAELAAAATPGGPGTSLGALPELKAAQARLDDLLTRVQQTGAELKGPAPLLVDFPSELDGSDVLLCLQTRTKAPRRRSFSLVTATQPTNRF